MKSDGPALAPASERPQGSGRNLALATAAFALCFAAWGMLAPLAPKVQDKLSLSDTETAIMIAIPVVLGSLLRLPLGWITDKVGGRIVFTFMLAYSAGAALLIGLATSYVALLGAGFLLGVAGASFAVGIPFVADWYPQKRQGYALGVYGVGNIGTAVAAFSVPFLYTEFGQLSAGIAFGVALGAFTLIWASAAHNAPGVKHPPPEYRQVLRSGWPLWQLSFFYFVTFGGFVAMAIFLPKLLVDWFDLSLTDAGLRAAGFTILATAARPVGGWLSDRIKPSSVLAIAFFGVGVDATGLSWQATDPQIVPVTIFCLSMAGFLGLGNGAVFKLVPQQFPRSTGSVTGIVGAAGGLGGFFPPLVLGVVKDATGTFTMAFVFLVAFAWMSAGLALSMRVQGSAQPPSPEPLPSEPGQKGIGARS
jgi:NNP family nitrate/nitrite transporter-like MFS transporter